MFVMPTIAGHTFDHGVCSCGRRWLDIRPSTSEDIDKPGIAHVGNLTHNELMQIVEAREAEDRGIAAAMGWAADDRDTAAVAAKSIVAALLRMMRSPDPHISLAACCEMLARGMR